MINPLDQFAMEIFLIEGGLLKKTEETAEIDESSLKRYIEECIGAKPPQNLGTCLRSYNPEGGIERLGVVYGEKHPPIINRIETLPEFDGNDRCTILRDGATEAKILGILGSKASGTIHNHPGSDSIPTIPVPEVGNEWNIINRTLKVCESFLYVIVCSMTWQKFLGDPNRYTNVYLFRRELPHLMYSGVKLVK